MRILIDTNVLLRSAAPQHRQHAAADRAMSILIERGDQPVIVPQVIDEFWVVATRPVEQNGLGVAPADEDTAIEGLGSFCTLLAETAEVLPAWRALGLRQDVKGKAAHDARIPATMSVHGVCALLTFNRDDFARFSLEVLTPQSVICSTAT